MCVSYARVERQAMKTPHCAVISILSVTKARHLFHVVHCFLLLHTLILINFNIIICESDLKILCVHTRSRTMNPAFELKYVLPPDVYVLNIHGSNIAYVQTHQPRSSSS